MIMIKTPEELARMRTSGRIAADVRDRIAGSVAPGVTTAELNDYAVELMKEHGVESAFFGYRGYPGYICISVNEEVVHGIPGKRRIAVGDIVSIDVGIRCEEYVGDTATTVMVGVSDLDVVRLVAVTEKALQEGIRSACAGSRVSDISHAIETVAVEAGFSVIRDFVGHGIGRDMHEDPQVPNFGRPGRGAVLEPGMTLALEPMVSMGGAKVEVMNDGWTVLTRDRRPSAHFEHTVAVRKEGVAEVLT
jgi:methionyl aminopeptidase